MDTQAKKRRSPVDPKTAAQKLSDYFSGFSGAIIAYSGGVDSALLAYAAHRALGDDMVAALDGDMEALERCKEQCPLWRRGLNIKRRFCCLLYHVSTIGKDGEDGSS